MAKLFFVQATAKGSWHLESDDNCEVMLCGAVIPVDLPTSKVQNRCGKHRCASCWMRHEEERRLREFAPCQVVPSWAAA